MNLLIRPDGDVVSVYAEAIDLQCLGEVTIRRASHVEPDAAGRWWANRRSDAVAAEVEWLTASLLFL